MVDGGVSTPTAATEGCAASDARNDTDIEASAIGAQGAVDRQPSADHGKSHGAW